jgi:glycosyltransferase involved in cell wall biosynthesis
MRILHVISDLKLSSGGPPITLLRLYKYINKLTESFIVTSEIDKNIKNEYDYKFIKEKFDFPFFFKIKFFNLLKKLNPDIVHIHGIWHPYLVCFIIASLFLNINYIIQPMGALGQWALKQKSIKKYFFLKTFYIFLLKNTKVILVSSYLEKKELLNIFPDLDSKIQILPIGIDQPSISLKKKQLKINKFLFISRLHPKKNIEFLIELWSILVKEKIDLYLDLVGEGDLDYTNKLKKKVKYYNLEKNINFAGPKYFNDLDIFYKKNQIFIFPSKSENFGVVILEALSNGLPVITSNQTPWEDLDLKKCGWRLNLDIESFQDLLKKIILGKFKNYNSYSQNAILYSKEFSWEKISKKLFLNIYLKI